METKLLRVEANANLSRVPLNLSPQSKLVAELATLATALGEQVTKERIAIMSADLANAGIPVEFVAGAIRSWRTGELVKPRKQEFSSSGRVYVAYRKRGTIDQTEARFFPKTPQLRVLAEELAEIAFQEAERKRKQRERIEAFYGAEREVEQALADHGDDSQEYSEALDRYRRFYEHDLPPRKEFPYASWRYSPASKRGADILRAAGLGEGVSTNLQATRQR